MADLILPRGEQKVLKAEDKNYDRGLLVKLLDNGGYDMAYWYDKPDKPYPVEVLVDGKSIKKDAKVVEMKFHPKDYYDKVEEKTMNEGISVFDERHFGKKGIIIMINDNGKTVSAIFKDKKNADKFNRNKPSDIKKLLKLAKSKKYPQAIDEARGSCWVGYKQIGMKDKGGRKVPNCVKEEVDIYYEENGKGYGYTFEFITDKSLQEAEYQGRKVKLNKIMQGDQKKFKVYVKNPKGNVVKVNFGQGGKAKGGTMRIRKSNPGARKSFRARHNCDNPGPKH